MRRRSSFLIPSSESAQASPTPRGISAGEEGRRRREGQKRDTVTVEDNILKLRVANSSLSVILTDLLKLCVYSFFFLLQFVVPADLYPATCARCFRNSWWFNSSFRFVKVVVRVLARSRVVVVVGWAVVIE